MNAQTKPSSAKEDDAHNDPCMKTLTVKILARCWENEYEEIRNTIGSVLSYSRIPGSSEIHELAASSARKNVAMALMVLVGNREECGEELFLPFLEMRCQKELNSLQNRVESAQSGTEQDYYSSAKAAWGNVLYIISQP